MRPGGGACNCGWKAIACAPTLVATVNSRWSCRGVYFLAVARGRRDVLRYTGQTQAGETRAEVEKSARGHLPPRARIEGLRV